MEHLQQVSDLLHYHRYTLSDGTLVAAENNGDYWALWIVTEWVEETMPVRQVMLNGDIWIDGLKSQWTVKDLTYLDDGVEEWDDIQDIKLELMLLDEKGIILQ